MNSIVRIFWLFFTLVVISSCNKAVFKPALKTPADDLNIADFNFDYLKAKAKFRYDDGRQNLKATANIRVRHDSLIWMSISASLGIEAARVMISQDSMIVLDRLNKQYKVFRYDELSARYNFKVNYDLLQSILLGDLSSPIAENDKIAREPAYFLVLQNRGEVQMENYIGSENMKLERVKWLDMPSKNTLTINYTNFQLINELAFPHENQIVLKYTDKENTLKSTRINIDYSKAELSNKKEKFPFNIPQKYERR